MSSQGASSSLAGVLANLKGFIFYTTTFMLALPLFAVMLLLTPFVMIFDKHRRLAQHFVNNIWAKVSTMPYYSVQVGSAFLLDGVSGDAPTSACWSASWMVLSVYVRFPDDRLKARSTFLLLMSRLCMWQITRASW